MRWPFRWSPFDLVTDPVTGKLSSSKIGLVVTFGVITYKFLQIPAASLSVDMLVAYGALGGSNHVAIYWLKKKYGCPPDRPES